MANFQVVRSSLNLHRVIRGASTALVLATAITSAEAQTAAAKPQPVYATVHAPNAQALLDKVVANHKEAKLVGLHMTLPDTDQDVIIACTDSTRLGKPSSKGDVAIKDTQKPVVRRKDKDGVYDVQAPLYDSKGKLIGMMVELVPTSAANTDDEALKDVENLRAELQKGIPSAKWMFKGDAK